MQVWFCGAVPLEASFEAGAGGAAGEHGAGGGRHEHL